MSEKVPQSLISVCVLPHPLQRSSPHWVTEQIPIQGLSATLTHLPRVLDKSVNLPVSVFILVDALKQAVDSLWKPGKDSVVVTRVRNAIHKEIVDQVPQYAETMKAYEKAVKFEKEIMKELSVNNKAAAATTLRKLQSTMRNNASTNYGARLKLLMDLDPDLLPALAGQSLNQLTPRGIQRVIGGGQIGASALGYVDPINLIPV